MNPIARCFIFFFLSHLVFFMNLAESKCQKSFNCGDVGSLEWPLSNEPGCGLVLVNCTSIPTIQFEAGGPRYRILQKLSTNKFRVVDELLSGNLTTTNCVAFGNIALPVSPLTSFTISPNLTIFSCSNFLDPDDKQKVQDYIKSYRTYTHCDAFTLCYSDQHNNVPTDVPRNCSIAQMPRKPVQSSGDLLQQLSPEFDVEWHISPDCLSCHRRGGKCVVSKDNHIHCEGKSRKTVMIRASTIAGSAVFLGLCFVFSCVIYRRRKRSTGSHLLSRKVSSDPSSKSKIEGGGLCFGIPIFSYRGSQHDIELFLKNNRNLAPRRFKYSDLKKMTNSFRENLGKGGYGSVYKGRLPNGRLVAVKILNESKENGEDFINEIASISRTSHINIVTLLGFCYEGSKRVLVYDFMPNGSLDKFIQNTAEWQKLFEIAVGIARGLEYLHKGCNTRILHFDIKPHNILLDEDFIPKISDFGLAKLCPNRSSTVSMLAARGTIGYIAPEVFCRNFGQVSYKSDVYSYGMMILEIVGGRKNIDPGEVDHSSEMYFPQHIYKQLEMDDKNGVLEGIMIEDESQYLKRKMIIVGLWCIQTDPKDRPSMSRVVEMLEGKLESLQVPPKPYLSSPQRPRPNSSTFESM
ncbi:Serine/threonine protein kinase [Handroanthus impetiginosus]|uniref:Serine/threonine protein kinase n=1 Tax=Handroanthus impetiginosus TaxID=429701 RepID=A0A2G9HBU0_9LAMI|nr:Serine/threonine protein kinase [Handroanthus impetiginosus]